MSAPERHKTALEIARQAVTAAGQEALRHFAQGVEVKLKEDQSPVTAADIASENIMLEIIRSRDPSASIIAEESGIHDHSRSRRWIIDPIDGTRGFTRGGEFWGPLIALEEDGEIVVGAMMLPVRNEVYWASKGGGAFKNDTRLHVSSVAEWPQSTLSLGETSRLLRPPLRSAVVELAATATSTRSLGDLAGVTMVLNGLAEVWIEHGVKPWDVAPSKILIEESGGRWTTYAGTLDISEGSAVGSNGLVHEHVLHTLQNAN
ncbi:MAG: inositol monophosphatase [Myxococcales bacterium]|nr:inositol monophosphatase [Myxococcales bacterium]